jgi:hypothetical protein
MKSRELASLALKLLGVYAIIEALPLLQYLQYVLAVIDQAGRRDSGMQPWTAVLGLVPLLLMAGTAFLLLTRSDGLARMLVPEDREMVTGGLSGQEIQTIAFSVAGAMVFILGVPALLQVILRLTILGPAYYGSRQSVDSWFVNVVLSGIGPFLQCALGFILFFRSRGVANFWHNLPSARYVKAGAGESTERREE